MVQSLRMASTHPERTRVIGIDPGLNITGYGVVAARGSDVKLLEAGVVRLPPSKGDNLPARLESLFHELQEIMQHDPDTVPAAIDLIFVARNLERIGDHTTNIAEDVVFLVEGVDVRHHADTL